MELETRFHECFRTEKRFEDKCHFPYGFLKSGDFTIEQARILELKGHAYAELASGERMPKGETEREFVAFCQGKKEAQTIHERVWQRYQSKVLSGLHAVSFNKKRLSQQELLEGCI
ncbi:DUF413 domain-containing protein [Neptuniibacter sp.]|uniref:DUF413 domain-containing protein n=1 Tax=Neptuniibacter sp. TaxID=1962643 RepID=UPI003B59339E